MLATQPLPLGDSVVTSMLSLVQPLILPRDPSPPRVEEVRSPSPVPEGPSVDEGVPPERGEGDWRSAFVGANSIFRDYGPVERLLDLILLPTNQEERGR